MSAEILGGRTTAGFPLSMGTSIAMEAIGEATMDPPADKEIVKPEKIKLSDYQQIWLNISTLFRNLHNSVKAELRNQLNASDCANVLFHEIDTIESICSGVNSSTKINWYVCTYKQLVSTTSQAKARLPVSKTQTEYYKLHDATIELMIKGFRDKRTPNFFLFNIDIRPQRRGKSLIVTHMPNDLLSHERFQDLHLLECHTGKVKTRNMWYTKFYINDGVSNIPFNTKTLRIFGDKYSFKPLGAKVREAVVVLSKQRKWTWATSESRVLSDFRSIPDKEIRDTLMSL